MTLNWTVLDTSKVLLFVKSVNLLDHKKVGLLLETDEGLTTDKAVVKRVCGRFDKWHDWNDAGSSTTDVGDGRKLEEPVLMSADETRRWIESGTTLTNVVSGPSGGATLEELTKMVCDVQIAQA